MVWGRNSPFDDEMAFSTVTGRIPDSLLLNAVHSNKISPGHNTTETVTTTYKFRLQIYGSSVLWSVAFGPPDHLCTTFLLADCLLQFIASFSYSVHYSRRDMYRPGLPSLELSHYCVLERHFLFGTH